MATPSPIALPRDHPRLGGWAELVRDRARFAQPANHSARAADNVTRLIRLEEEGLAAAHGPLLVHFDLYPHDILLTPQRVLFVDWPHARLGASVVDLVIVLSSAADSQNTNRRPSTPFLAARRIPARRRTGAVTTRARSDRRGQTPSRPRRTGLAPTTSHQLRIGRRSPGRINPVRVGRTCSSGTTPT
jgi:thiamine kinase-like enzyme